VAEWRNGHPSPVGRVDARPGGKNFAVTHGSPHPTRARLSPPREPPSPQGGGMTRCAAIAKPRFNFQTATCIPAARFCARVIRPMRSRKVRGRAGRRGSDGPTGLDASPHRSGTAISAETGVRSVEPQVRLLSSVPRAVFEAFLRMAPGGLSLLSTALDPDSAWPFGTELRRCHQRARCRQPVATGRMQLQPPRFGCACCTRARPPLSGPA
jgi:hypothetical protein